VLAGAAAAAAAGELHHAGKQQQHGGAATQQPPAISNGSYNTSAVSQQRAALAELLLNGGKPAEALACVDAALTAAPSSTHLLHLRGRCLLAAGNVPGGRLWCRNVVKHSL